VYQSHVEETPGKREENVRERKVPKEGRNEYERALTDAQRQVKVNPINVPEVSLDKTS